MKNILFTFLSLSLIFLSSCNKSSECKIYDGDIVGKWNLMSCSSYKITTTNELISSIIAAQNSYELYDTYNYVKIFDIGDKGFVYEEYEGFSRKTEFVYEISDQSILTITDSSETKKYKILELRKERMELVKDLTKYYKELYSKIYPDVEISEVLILQNYERIE